MVEGDVMRCRYEYLESRFLRRYGLRPGRARRLALARNVLAGEVWLLELERSIWARRRSIQFIPPEPFRLGVPRRGPYNNPEKTLPLP